MRTPDLTARHFVSHPHHASTTAPRIAGHRRTRAGRWRLRVLPTLVAAIFLAGVAVFLYPQTANWFSDLEHASSITHYDTIIGGISPAHRAAELAAARTYNSNLQPAAITDPFGTSPSGGSGTDDAYDRMLGDDPTGMMARIDIPSIHADLPIYHGTSDQVLARGVGHLRGTSLPVGGAGTHAVLVAHAGLPSAKLFTDLSKTKLGQTFTVEVLGRTLTYRIVSSRVVLPTDTQALYPVPGKDLVTLVTCTPIGLNTHRLLVTGIRIPTPSSGTTLTAVAAGPSVPWWAVIGALALAGAIAYLWMSGRGPRRAKSRASGSPRGNLSNDPQTGVADTASRDKLGSW